MIKLIALLRLTRPANQVTAIADVLAGIAVAIFFYNGLIFSHATFSIICLCISTFCLYGGGVVFNDYFDRDLDKIERPERPIPSGIIKPVEAAVLGSILLILGVIFATSANIVSGVISVFIVLAALIYDKWAKHFTVAGPIVMGLCRCFNLLLGVSILPQAIDHFWFIGLVPIVYIGSITLISQGEVSGGQTFKLYIASFLYLTVISFILIFILKTGKSLWPMLILLPFAALIFMPLIKAIKQPIPQNIKSAVKAGILALVILNAVWAAAVSQWLIMSIIIVLLPVSILLSKAFAVT